MGINPEEGGFSCFTREEMGLGPDESMLQYPLIYEGYDSGHMSEEEWVMPVDERFDLMEEDLDTVVAVLQKLQSLAGELLPAVQEYSEELRKDHETFQEEYGSAHSDYEESWAWEEGEDAINYGRLKLHGWIKQVTEVVQTMVDLAPLGKRWEDINGGLSAPEPDKPDAPEAPVPAPDLPEPDEETNVTIPDLGLDLEEDYPF